MGANQSALPAAPAIQDDDAPPATPIPMHQPPEPWVVPAGPPVFRVPAPPVPPPREPEVFPDFPPVINRVGNGWVADPPNPCLLSLKFRITIEDTDTIVRLLANGVPLMGALRMGALFAYLKAMQIYYAPGPYKGLWAHVVVLHGSGFASPKGTYYTCRNSYGYKVHGYYEKKDTGGDFNIWSSDLYGFVYGCELA
ncbi:hypothetical protein TRIUR3_20462 [Triticum urartu]|uniref:Uncharacterized protein n=1 Tax=Triticum urartu TaxID=4572 RepID=M7YV84_TRIUA|nr:hypothetical protein TRIUR3_20462 [Triticum urartu]